MTELSWISKSSRTLRIRYLALSRFDSEDWENVILFIHPFRLTRQSTQVIPDSTNSWTVASWPECFDNSTSPSAQPNRSRTGTLSTPEQAKSRSPTLDRKPFEWNCCQCVDALVETLDKMILATVLPSNDPVPCNKVSIVDSQPDSSSAGNLNDSAESTASGHGNKDMGQLLNDGNTSPPKSPPKDHGGNEVAEEIHELDWESGSQFPENRFPSHGIRAEFSSIEPKQNLFQLDIDRVKNSDLGDFNMPLHTRALESDWKELSCSACRIRNGIDSMRETTSMETAAITLLTAWISCLTLAMQVPVRDCRFQCNSVYTPPITSNDASTVMCV